MSKKAIYYDEAKRLYVQQGFGLTTIEGMLDGKISRRQLHNWKTAGKWDDKRKRYLAEHEDLGDMVMQIAKNVAKQALENPTPKNLLSLIRAINALKEKDALTILGEDPGESDHQKEAVDILKLIRKELTG